MRIVVIAFLFFITLFASAQDEILLMNGKQFKGLAIDTTSVKFLFDIQKAENRFKTKSFYRDEVFLISYSDSIEKVFYEADLYYEDAYSSATMKMLVMGKRDARYNFKTKWVMPVGFVVGAASAYFMEESIFILFVPIIYTGLVQIPIVKIQKESISSNAFIGDEFYAEGYNRSARVKRTKHALLSSIVGVIAGIVVYEIVN